MTCSWIASSSDPALPMPFLVSIQSHRLPEGSKRGREHGAVLASQRQGTTHPSPAEARGPCCMDGAIDGKDMGLCNTLLGEQEANPASKGDALRCHSWLKKPPTSSKQILLAYSQPSKCTGHFMPLAPKPFPWDMNGEGECLLCSRFFFVPESFSSCTESLPLF